MQRQPSACFFSLCCMLGLVLGCGNQSQEPLVQVIPSSGAPGKINSIQGTYGPGCTNRLGTWALSLDGQCPALPDAPLSVEEGNGTCQLTLTTVVVDCVPYRTRGLPLAPNYQSFGYPFFKDGDCDPTFYGNGNATDFLGIPPFVIKVLIDHNLGKTNQPYIVQADHIAAFVIDQTIPAPNYTLDVSALDIKINASRIVVQATGVMTLVPGIHSGERYVIVPELAAAQRTYAAIDALFGTQPQFSVGTPIPAAVLNVVGQSLPNNPGRKYDILVVHEESGIRSYEDITLTLIGP